MRVRVLTKVFVRGFPLSRSPFSGLRFDRRLSSGSVSPRVTWRGR